MTPRAADAAAGEHIVTIDGQGYPVARAGDGLMWRVADQGSEVRTTWIEWAEMGEAERRSGRRYFFGKGWDASVHGLLKLSPTYMRDLATGRLTTGFGHFFEATGISGNPTHVGVDASATAPAGSYEVSVEKTVPVGDERVLVVDLSYEAPFSSPERSGALCYYKGIGMERVDYITTGGFPESDSTTTMVFILVAPPEGTADVVFSYPSGKGGFGGSLAIGAMSYVTVDQDDPVRAIGRMFGESNAPSVAVESVAGDLVVDAVSIHNESPGVTLTVGAGQTQRWQATEGIDEVRGAGSDEAAVGVSTTMSWSASASQPWTIIGISLRPSQGRYVYALDGGKITKFTWDGATGPARIVAGDLNTTDGKAGHPVYANGKWYAPQGDATNTRRLDAVGAGADTWWDAGWKALCLSTRQEGIIHGFARGHSINKVSICNDAGNLVSWGDDFPVGDTSTEITDILEMLDELLVAKQDNLYRFDQAAASEPVISWRSRDVSDPDNGRGMTGHSGMIFYPSTEGLDRYLVVEARARPMGLDTLPFFRDVEELDGPAGGRHAFVTFAGPFIYLGFNHQEQTYICQGRFREDFEPPGAEILWHSILELPICKGAFVDSRKVLWLKGAAKDLGDRNIFTVQLAANGSTDACPARGQAGSEHYFYFDQVIDLPRVVKQARLFVLETENFGDPAESGTVTGYGPSWLVDSSKTWADTEYNDYFVIITSGAGAGQVRTIESTQQSNMITITENWTTIPAIGDSYIFVTKYVQAQVYRDGGAFENVGNPIGEDGLHELNWTVGTNDQVRRPRMALMAVTAPIYAPASEDPSVRFAELVQRAPSIYNVTIPLDDDNLQDQGPEAIRQTLLRLVNQGFVDIGEPDAVGDATWVGEVEKVGFTSYVDDGGNVSGGIEVRIARYVVD